MSPKSRSHPTATARQIRRPPKAGKKKLTVKSSEYRPAVVTFIDILGFREIVRQRPSPEILDIVRAAQHHTAASDADVAAEPELRDDFNWTRTFAFSDSVVRVRPFDATYSEGALFHEIIDLVHAQAELAYLGVLLRGGLTVGHIYFEENVLFGPGLVRAYDLESQYANFPRIVIDPDVFKEFRQNPKLRAGHHDIEDEVHYLKRVLSLGEDGLWFIDYLRAFEREMDDRHEYPDYMAKHRELIIKYAAAAEPSLKVLHKYLWLAQYHNRVCLDRFGRDRQTALLISRNDVSSLESLPEESQHIRDL